MKYEVPSKDYARQYRALWSRLQPELERVFTEENPILGAPVTAFEEDFARHVGCEHAVGVGSGTDALILALRALGIGEGDEVITSSHTFFATVSAILMCGARPVLVEPDPGSMLIDAAGVEAALGSRTRAVIPVHLYGRLCAMREIVELCASARIPILEDAAQAHGATHEGSRAGSLGRAGCFSFHPSKNLGAFGDGGIVTTSDPALAERIRELRNLGKTDKYGFGHIAPNTKLDTIQAAILRCKLPDLDRDNERRRSLAGIYARELADIGELDLPLLPKAGEHVFHLYVVRTQQRDALRGHLRERGINAGLHYPIPPHLQPALANLGYRRGDLPVAEALAETVLSLPIAPELSEEQIHVVCRGVREFFCA